MNNVHTNLRKLKSIAAEGDTGAEFALKGFRFWCIRELREHLETKMMSHDKRDYGSAIMDLLSLADFAIQALQHLSTNQPEKVREYARERVSWPAYIHLTAVGQQTFEDLRPKFDKIGRKTKESPIELGAGLGFSVNKNKTQPDILFNVATDAIFNVVRKIESSESHSWLHGQRGFIKRGRTFGEEERAYLQFLGPFTRSNWENWAPIFDRYVTLHHGPPSEKYSAFPPTWKELPFMIWKFGVIEEWQADRLNRRSPLAAQVAEFQGPKLQPLVLVPLQNEKDDLIKTIIKQPNKARRSKWNALKREILRRIERLAPRK